MSADNVNATTTGQELIREARLPNEHGLHARPAMQLVDLANRFESDIALCKGPLEVDGKSIIAVLTLGAEKGSVLSIKARGGDAADAVAALAQLVESGFGED